jgi:Arc/MetJ-type ribon-helix-helix transcriptional regulator
VSRRRIHQDPKAVSVVLDRKDRELLARLAVEIGVSRSEVVRVAIRLLAEKLSQALPNGAAYGLKDPERQA